MCVRLFRSFAARYGGFDAGGVGAARGTQKRGAVDHHRHGPGVSESFQQEDPLAKFWRKRQSLERALKVLTAAR